MSSNRQLTPFFSAVHDTFLIDRHQVEKFETLFRERSPFRRLDCFPWLDEALARTSERVLETAGEQFWEESGGVLDAAGRPLCKMKSDIAACVVEDLENDPGGLLWMDTDGVAWAVRLCRSHDSKRLFGFCINWGGTPPLSPAVVAEVAGLDHQDLESCRAELRAEANRLKLYERAQQLFWMIHAEVLRQRSSVVVLSDVALGQVVWGGDRDEWPQNWRQAVVATLRSLTRVRSEVLRLRGRGWNPQFGAESVAVASIEDLRNTGEGVDACEHSCPMHGSGISHSHLVVQIGVGFLGVLEQFAIDDSGDGSREYCLTSDDAKKRIGRSKQVVKANAVTKLLGGARWSGLHSTQRQILQALIGELTRGKVSARTVVNAAGKNVVCPLLDARSQYVVFGGNGSLKGRGYRIVGAKQTGWLHKCGIAIPDDESSKRPVVRKFLRHLSDLTTKFDLVVAAIHPKSDQWFDGKTLIKMAQTVGGLDTVLDAHLRVYAPWDYEDRIRAYFANQGGFGQIPRPRECVVEAADSMATLIHGSGSQAEVAALLGISTSHLSNLLCGRRNWTEDLVERCRVILAAR